MKVLLIGYGSIGKRHKEVLETMAEIETIDIVTRQYIPNETTFPSLTSVPNLNDYDYFVIASPTHVHRKQLLFLDSRVSDKVIFCEKPLFYTNIPTRIDHNRICVGYVLRYHPMLKYIKHHYSPKDIFAIHIHAASYLPQWRPNQDYRTCYSAKKEEGGGVLLDLSHELDYLQWIGGSIAEIKSIQGKFSSLEITSDDTAIFIGKTANGIFNCTLNYYSLVGLRQFILHTHESTIFADLATNILTITTLSSKEEKIFEISRNEMFLAMHKDILGKQTFCCSYEEGIQTMKIISTIQKENE